MVKRLSDLNKSIEYVPVPQSPDRAGMQKSWMSTEAKVPNNWFVSNGQAVSRTEYVNLFEALDTKYGAGDGSTTFNLPNGPWKSFDVELDLLNLSDGFVKTYARGKVDSDTLGNYYLDMWLRLESGFITNSFTEFEVNGVSWYNPTTRTEQALGLSTDNNSPPTRSFVFADTGIPIDNRVRLGGEGTHNTLIASGRVKLAGVPVDSFLTADANYSTVDEMWQEIPIIKAYDDDDARVAISTTS